MLSQLSALFHCWFLSSKDSKIAMHSFAELFSRHISRVFKEQAEYQLRAFQYLMKSHESNIKKHWLKLISLHECSTYLVFELGFTIDFQCMVREIWTYQSWSLKLREVHIFLLKSIKNTQDCLKAKLWNSSWRFLQSSLDNSIRDL